MESNTLLTNSIEGLTSGPLLDIGNYDASLTDSLASLQPRNSHNTMLPSLDDGALGRLSKATTKPTREQGSPGDDKFTARGNIIYKALGGDDKITVKKTNNTIVGGGGNDTINATKGKGDNVLKGGGGDDEIIGGGRNDLLVGGGGADLLVIADGKLNKGVSIIKGFKHSDAIAIRDVKKADSFDDLTFQKQGKDTLIQVGNRDIALVQKAKPQDLQKRADDFIFGDEEDNDEDIQLPVLSISDFTWIEGNANSTATFTLTLDAPSSVPITVDYATTDGTAIATSDYTAANGTFTFAANTTSQTIAIPILGDDVEEGDETFTLSLSNVSGATLGTGTATVTILNDDVAPEFRDKRTGKKRERPSAAPDLVFSIFDTLPTGQVITDSDDSETGGLFIGAIEEFDFTTDGFFNGIDSILLFSVGDLTATRSGDFITYQFSSEQVDVDVDNPVQSIDKETTEAVSTLLLTVDLNSASMPDDFDPVQAVNNLDYIIGDDVFQYASSATAYGGDSVLDISFSPDICAPGSVCEDLEEEVA